MNEGTLHTLNPMSDLLLKGAGRLQMPSLRIGHRQQPSNVDTDRVLVDPLIRRANSTAVTNGIRRCTAPAELWLSTVIIEWPHQAEVEYLLTIFDGELGQHIGPSLRNAGFDQELTGVR